MCCVAGSCGHSAGGRETSEDQRCVKGTTTAALQVQLQPTDPNVCLLLLLLLSLLQYTSFLLFLSIRTLEFLMRHLVKMASFSSETNMHARNLAIVWAPNLLRCVVYTRQRLLSTSDGVALGGTSTRAIIVKVTFSQ